MDRARRSGVTDLEDLTTGNRWLIAFRMVFAGVMLGSTLLFCAGESIAFDTPPFIYLIDLALVLFSLSLVYSLIFNFWGANSYVIYGQVVLDTVTVTVILFLTGGFSSAFTFLYLLVIIGVSMILHRTGSMVVAALCSVQYGLMIDLEYYGILVPLGSDGALASSFDWTHIIYRMAIMMTACFVVAVLTGILAVQARRARRELVVMERHLRRVEKMAAIGELAAGMAHEIKNPLASLSGSIQLLKEEITPGTHNHRLMQIVLRETDRLSKLVTDFLLFAAPRRMDTTRIRLDRVLEETVAMFEQDALCRENIVFHMRIRCAVTLSMDEGHLRQVLLNLLKNAAEAMEAPGRIFIDLRALDRRRAQLRITDEGCGMSAEIQSMIFDPFYTTKCHGTGLGLAITHRIMDTYGGLVDVESTPGKGTRFTLIFKALTIESGTWDGSESQQNLDTPTENGVSIKNFDKTRLQQ